MSMLKWGMKMKMIEQFFYNHFFTFMAIISVFTICVMIAFTLLLTKLLNFVLDNLKED